MSVLGNSPLIAFVATKNGAQARQFYGETLGLRIVSDDPYALVVDAHGTSLRIQKVGTLEPRSFTVLGWQVSDIDATVDGLTKRGVEFQRFDGMQQDERGVWTSPSGARVAWFKDPDGNTLSLTET
jgi:catechol 2,3-dioxygenase-like lactoylglutathione lyase family enzyme